MAAGIGGAALLSIARSFDGDDEEDDIGDTASGESGSSSDCDQPDSRRSSTERRRSQSFSDLSVLSNDPFTTSSPPRERPPSTAASVRLLPSGLSNSISACVSATSDNRTSRGSERGMHRQRSRSLGHADSSVSDPEAFRRRRSRNPSVSSTCSTSSSVSARSSAPLPLDERIAFKKWHL